MEDTRTGQNVPGLLHGKVALVTGASRGAGKGIALALGQQGATVFVTGRSTRSGSRTEGLPGTVDDTAESVSAAGGRGIAVACDHTEASQVESLFARVRQDTGRLDVLVNNAWGGYENYDQAEFIAPFWEQPLRRWDAMFHAGVRTHFLTNRFAVPLMLTRRSGLIIGTVAWAFGAYLGNLYYDTAKAAIIRMTFGMGEELRPHGIAAIALAPGFMRTERVLAVHAAHPFDLSGTESPGYVARAVIALASDRDVLKRSGQLLTAGELALEYGFTDTDGRRPPPFRIDPHHNA